MTQNNQKLDNSPNVTSNPIYGSDSNEPVEMRRQNLHSDLSSTLSTIRSSVEEITEPVEDPPVELDNDLNSRTTTGRDTDNHDGLRNNR